MRNVVRLQGHYFIEGWSTAHVPDITCERRVRKLQFRHVLGQLLELPGVEMKCPAQRTKSLRGLNVLVPVGWVTAATTATHGFWESSCLVLLVGGSGFSGDCPVFMY